jgi:hypothetical protein
VAYRLQRYFIHPCIHLYCRNTRATGSVMKMNSWVLVAHFAYERAITPVITNNPLFDWVLDF